MLIFVYLTVCLFSISLFGLFITRKNIIIVLMAIELIFLAINLNFIIFSIYLNDILGQVFSIFILTLAAADSAIGLAIVVVYYRLRGTISIDFVNMLKG